MKIYECEQRSPEWYQIRDLKLTASNATAIMAAGKGLDTLIMDILTEHYSSGNFEEFSNKPFTRHMQRGVEFENKARQIYALETGLKVKEVGFVEYNEYVGCSPDGLVEDDGLLEIKNLSDKEFMNLLITGKIDSGHRNQMQMQLFVTDRKWCDYFAFNPNFEPCYVRIRILPDEEAQVKLAETIEIAIKKLKQKKEILDKQFEMIKSVA